jgi:glyoxylase-like metal-dependent hydrolase (beta-lactamase superfamily II)
VAVPYKTIAPGIYQLQVPIPNNPLGYVLPYLIEGDDGYMLVDSGWDAPEAYGALMAQLHALGVPLKELKRVAFTHVHPDHYGLAGRLKGDCDAELMLGAPERGFINTRYRAPEGLLDRMGEWLRSHGVPEDKLGDLRSSAMSVRGYVNAADPDTLLLGGERLKAGNYEWEVIWTPGHSPGHMCFYDAKNRIMITGDHVLPTISPNVSLHPEQPGNPLHDYILSLRRLLNYPVDLALPAHEYDFLDLHERIRELEEHHEERMQEMLDGMSGQPATAYQIAAHVKWVTGSFEEFTPWMQRSAIGETLSHLEHMVMEGILERTFDDGKTKYKPVNRARRASPGSMKPREAEAGARGS